jgi:dTDP-4-dehydrorhamnose reductase
VICRQILNIKQSKEMKILVTGANGQLGKALRNLAKHHPEHTFMFLSREDLPIHHFELVRNFFRADPPDVCINAAAYTAVDRAESERDLAFQVNAEAVGVLAAVCREHGTRFIHVSTDYVFDGNSNRPYKEDDATGPLTVYGASKLDGEQQALSLNPATVVIRTSWVYHETGKNFVKTIMRLLAEKPFVGVVNDQFGAPTYAGDLAECIMNVAIADHFVPGIFHFSNDGEISWYDFALEIARQIQSQTEVRPITTPEFPTPARRPAYSLLDKSKIISTYGIELKPWKQSLEHCIQAIKAAQS